MDALIWLLTAIHVVVAVFLIFLILMQKSKDQGIGAAFGAGVTDTVFGAGTTTALVRMTIWCACILLATTLLLAMLHARRSARTGPSLIQRVAQPEPGALPLGPTPAPAPTTPLPAPDSAAPPAAPATVPERAPTPAPAP